ncbi:MAG: cryptochrome/photolyase family protein [Bacteroidota bacterium]
MNTIGLLFPHQLFRQHEMFEACDVIYLVEEYLFFKHYAFHQQKIAFHRASMKALEAHLSEKGVEVHYVDSPSETSDIRVLIPALAEQHEIATLHYIDPTDEWLSRRIKSASEAFDFECIVHENPLFLTAKSDLHPFFRKDKKSFFQTTFYKQQRKKLDVLMEADDQPMGGKWTFDTANRKKYPKGKTPPSVSFPDTNPHWKEALAYVGEHFSDNYGELADHPRYPLTHQAAKDWFQQFLEIRFHYFGDYEDAIVKDELILHHSLLSPLINVGLLDVRSVLDESVQFAEVNDIPINSTEGFVRQIIGWREFIRGMYECKGNESRTTNFWGFDRKIPASFYDGSTGIPPVDDSIKKVLKTGYCHHIERLMILGNFMLLCEFDPDEVYRWFMELFIDAYDWVMVPNVYGMSQFSDGGFFATKPYISGSNYIKKMSDYSSGDWQKTWDGLFWRFMHVNRGFFDKNPRLAMLLSTYDRMSEEKQRAHLNAANRFLEQLDAG